jgi:hypothetical protein
MIPTALAVSHVSDFYLKSLNLNDCTHKSPQKTKSPRFLSEAAETTRN